MNPIEISCEPCDARMRLSARLLTRIDGRTGRVTCKSCGNKLGLDARGDGIVVTSGGALVESGEALKLEDAADTEPHLSELPGPNSESRMRVASLPPPLPTEATADGVPPSVRRGAENASLLDLVAEVTGSRPPEVVDELPEEELRTEAPLPPMRATEDSLSPHTLVDDDDSLVPLGREFDSTPFAAPSPRDAAYSSLYPEVNKRASSKRSSSRTATAPSSPATNASRAPAPPRAGELRRSSERPSSPFDDTFGLAPNSAPRNLIVSEDGRLLNDTDLLGTAQRAPEKSRKWAWGLAAAALMAMGVAAGSQGGKVLAAVEGTDPGADALPVLSMASAAAVSRGGDVQGLPQIEPTFITAEALASNASVGVVESANASAEASLKKPVAASNRSGSTTGGSKSKPSQGTKVEGPLDADAPEHATTGSQNSAEAEPAVVVAPFSAPAASAALREATAMAASCRRPTDPNGKAKVVVTFAPSGRVTRATVSGPPYAGTPTGGCIASRFRAARVPGFAGASVTVSKTVTIR